jgi:TonB family protein
MNPASSVALQGNRGAPLGRSPLRHRPLDHSWSSPAGVVCLLVFWASGCASPPTTANEPHEPGPAARGATPVDVKCGNVEAPRLIQRVEAAYPAFVRQARLEGTVIMEGIITTEGAVSDIKVLRSPSEILSKLAVHAISQWRYKPAFCKDLGRAIRVNVTMTTTFNLQQRP